MDGIPALSRCLAIKKPEIESQKWPLVRRVLQRGKDLVTDFGDGIAENLGVGQGPVKVCVSEDMGSSPGTRRKAVRMGAEIGTFVGGSGSGS